MPEVLTLSEATIKALTRWFKERPPEHATTEAAALVKEFGLSQTMARAIRALAGRDNFTDCPCCEAIGDHACGGECQRCGGSGRNPSKTVACQLPHSLDCTCSWAEEM